MTDISKLNEPAPEYGSELYTSLPSFWSRMYDDRTFIKRLCQGFGMTLEQLKVQFGETQDCLGRTTIPPYRRVKNAALSIRKSERNTGDTVNLHFGMDPAPNVGPQPEDSPYTPYAELSIGGAALRRGYAAYPLHGHIPDSGVLLITDRLSEPYLVMVRGRDFYIDGSSIVFRDSRDPFSGLSRFFMTGTVEAEDGTPDQVLLMWGIEALYDDEYVEQHFGQMYDGAPSDPQYHKEIINAAGDLYSEGTAEYVMRKSLGALFRTPVAKETETILDIGSDGDQTIVVTAKNMYLVRSEETLKPGIEVGYELGKGEFLTDTVRLYQTLNPNYFEQRNGLTLEEFESDFPELHLRKGVAAVSGLSLVWDSVPVIYRGKDENDNNLYSFNVSADEATDTLFWEYVFDRVTKEEVDMAYLLADHVQPGHAEVIGEAVGTVIPVRYFLTNFFCANASAIAVDFDALPQYIKELDINRIVSEVSAVYTGTFIVVRLLADTDTYEIDVDAGESLTDIPAVPLADETMVTDSLTYYDATVTTRRVRI